MKNLALWLSSVINDAIRDAREAGLDRAEIWYLLDGYTRSADPVGLHRRPDTEHVAVLERDASGEARTPAGARVDSKA